MKKIHRSQIPLSLPISFTVLGWLFFDRLKIPACGWGVWWTVCILVWAIVFYDIFASEYVKVDLQ